jgi:hypothetical protein
MKPSKQILTDAANSINDTFFGYAKEPDGTKSLIIKGSNPDLSKMFYSLLRDPNSRYHTIIQGAYELVLYDLYVETENPFLKDKLSGFINSLKDAQRKAASTTDGDTIPPNKKPVEKMSEAEINEFLDKYKK